MSYLRDHPPARSQFRSPRRERLIGVIGVHTTEGVLDDQGPDMGAENTARYISTRDTPGSYHDIADTDSAVQVVDYGDEAFHIATHALNRRTTGLAFACRTVDWARMSAADRASILDNGAQAAARQARHHKATAGIVVPARRITLADALAKRPGFLAHGDADPARRTDPGIKAPDLFPWDEFFTRYRIHAADVLGIAPTPAPKDFLMALTDKQQTDLYDRIVRIDQNAEAAVTEGRTHKDEMIERTNQLRQWTKLGVDILESVAAKVLGRPARSPKQLAELATRVDK